MKDSASAFSIMESLRKVAKASGTNLIVTIHQPSELVFEMGDNLLLLSGGHQIYFGPVLEVEQHFNALGFRCPKRTSIAEWLLDLVNRDFGAALSVDRCVAAWPGSPAHKALEVIRLLHQNRESFF
jgi:ABC-type multidrug transport system ATPase subunit